MSAHPLWILPFILILASIAIFPLAAKHWWEKNYAWLAAGLSLPVLFHYLFQLRSYEPVIHSVVDYVGFIILIGALYIISGGIHITVKGEATPLVNTVFLFIGAVLANFLGTTGASVVLIRPWIRMNKYRITAFHTVFFIFIVSNLGGSLTPLGDPPLFLGYLKGVPFFWVFEYLWLKWLIGVGLTLAIFFVIDSKNFKRAPREIREIETASEEWKFEGFHNFFFIAMVIGAIFIKNPPYVREFLMVTAAVLSYKTTSKAIHHSNDFNFEPIKEVAILFAGIFITMIPALEWLSSNASALGVTTPGQFYWACGILSSMLDNAPTYLNFLSTAIGLFIHDGGAAAGGHGGVITREQVESLVNLHPHFVQAISISAVYFGAMTYIGNGPNLLVKSIAEQAKVKVPSFFGYIFRYSLPILLPIFTLVWFLFFRSSPV